MYVGCHMVVGRADKKAERLEAEKKIRQRAAPIKKTKEKGRRE